MLGSSYYRYLYNAKIIGLQSGAIHIEIFGSGARFNAGSRIIENNLRWCFFLFLAPAGALTLRDLIIIPFLILRDKAYLYLT